MITLSQDQPVRHLEVSQSACFYMNHSRGFGNAAHDHNFLEIAFILNGKTRHFAIQSEEECSAGDVYIIPIGAWHGYREGEEFEIANCLLSPALLERELAWLKEIACFRDLFGLDRPIGLASVRRLRLSPTALQSLLELLDELETVFREEGSRVALLGRLLLVLDLLQEAYGKAAAAAAPEAPSHAAVRQAVDLLCNGIAEEWSLERLAACLRLSPSYLVRLFRAQMNVPPMQFLSRIRGERAATLLLFGKMRIGDIGVAVGWPDPKQFAACFQRHFGLSASAYRKKMM